MTSDEYIKKRVVDQIDWYDRNSRSAKSAFKNLRRIEIIAAASIPFVAGLGDWSWAGHIVSILGVIVVILAAFQSLGQHHENWLEYRTTCESLKHEKFLFLTKSAPYDSDSAFGLFVERIEALLSKQNTSWAKHSHSGGRASRVGDK